MKLLVATACVCVIAVTGYFFYGVYASHHAGTVVAEREAHTELARKEIFQFAGATDDDVPKVRNWCSYLSDNIGKSIDDSSVARNVLQNCRALGYL